MIGYTDVVKPAHAVEMYRLIPNCKLTVLSAGHGDFLGEITVDKEGSWLPGIFLAVVENFLH